MQTLSNLLTAPRVILAARLFSAAIVAGNLLLAIVCLCLIVRGDWLGLALGLVLLLPTAAWFLAFRGPLTGARAFAIAFLAVSALWTVNEMLPCAPGQCNVSGFLVVSLPALTDPTNLGLLLSAFLFYAAHRLQSRPTPQQLSST